MIIFRPVCTNDLNGILRLASRVGVGLTTLPNDPVRMEHRIQRSIDSFANKIPRGQKGFFFVLEDTETSQVIGTSAIEVAVGLHEPFYNFRIQKAVRASKELGIYKNLELLNLSYDHTGHTELCTLFLDPEYQKNRNGQFLSKARFLFIAAFRHLFSARLFAELRGVIDDDGKSPFWDALGSHFFDIDFADADRLTGVGMRTFIVELMPVYPIYIALLPKAAQRVIGQVHPQTMPARHILEKEGFQWHGSVDIFDAGPVIEANTNQVRIIRESQLLPAKQVQTTTDIPYIVTNDRFEQFRAILLGNLKTANTTSKQILTSDMIDALQLQHPTNKVRAVALNP